VSENVVLQRGINDNSYNIVVTFVHHEGLYPPTEKSRSYFNTPRLPRAGEHTNHCIIEMIILH